jgi:anti-anti-sigma factor
MSMDVDTMDTTVVRFAGHLDGRCSAEVRQTLYDHVARHPDRDLVVDLSGVESIDATALKVLAAFSLRLDRDGRRVVLRGGSASLRRLFAATGWRRLFVWERG